MSSFTSILLVSPLADGRTWVVMSEFGYDVGSLGSGDHVAVRIGFQTDFATIPRLFWVILPTWGKYGNAAVIHDWLYWTRERSRKASDDILLEGMEVLNVGRFTRYPIYWAVRLFGWFAWMRNQADRTEGFNRVLAELPAEAGQESQRPGALLQLGRHAWRKIRPER